MDRHSTVGSRWSPSQYILEGHFCPIEDIQATLSSIRVALKADEALLLVADVQALYRNLCLVDTPDELGAHLLALLHKGVYPGRYKIADFVVSARPGQTSSRRFPHSAKRLVAELAALAKFNGRKDVESWVTQGPWRPVKPYKVGAHIRRGAFSAVLVRTFHGDEATPIDAEDYSRQLAEMVNGTALANVRRDSMVMLRMDETVDPRAFLRPDLSMEDAAAGLTNLAADITGSDAAVCYLRSRTSPRRFSLIAESAVTAESSVIADSERHDRGRPLRELYATHPRRLAERAIADHRAILTPPGIGDNATLESVWGGLPGAGVVELATPIPGPLASPRTPAVGVLVVRKRPAQPGDSYGAYDMALLRNVALRVALLFASYEMASAASVFSHRVSASHGKQTPSYSWRTQPDMPDDLLGAAPQICDVLTAIRRITGSHSATFRIPLPSLGTRHPSGLVLVRACASPARRLFDKDDVQPEEIGGLNWEAVRSGRLQYKNSRESRDMRSHDVRPSTVSELCVPVRIDNRLVGVANFESPLPNAYDGLVATVDALVQQIAMALTQSRLVLVNPFYNYASELLRRGHNFANEARNLRDSAEKKAPEPLKADLMVVAASIDRQAREFRDMPVQTTTSKTLAEVVDSCVDKVKVQDVVCLHRELATTKFDQRATETLTNIVTDMIYNVKQRRKGDVEIRFGTMSWNGTQHEAVCFEHDIKTAIGAHRAANAFRIPIIEERSALRTWPSYSALTPRPRRKRTGRESRLGAFAAGSLARGLGGDAYLASRGNRVCVRLIIPVPA